MMHSELTYVVEDDPITATITKVFLEKNVRSTRVQTYANGQRALDQLATVLAQGGELPNLILLDLNMPLMDGWEFLAAFDQLPLAVPVCVLVLTSSINPADYSKAARSPHVAGYFAKPLDLNKITHLLRLRRKALGPGPRKLDTTRPTLHHLVYQSQTITALSESALAQLLTQSRAFNAAHGLTGVLLYSQGNILQVLEGTEGIIAATFARIARDPSHSRVVKLADGPIADRQFAHWSMGFQVIAPAEFAHLIGYLEPSQTDCLTENFRQPDPELHTLLASFTTHDSLLPPALAY